MTTSLDKIKILFVYTYIESDFYIFINNTLENITYMHIDLTKEYMPPFYKYNLIIIDPFSFKKFNCHLIDNIPIIIIMKEDSSSMCISSFLKLLNKPNLLAIWKTHILRYPQMYNYYNSKKDYKIDETRYHFYLIYEALIQKQHYYINNTLLSSNKIKCVPIDAYQNAYYHIFKPLQNQTIDYTKNRPLDVLAVWTSKIYDAESTSFGKYLYILHRDLCTHKIEQLKANSKYNIICNIKLPRDKFYDHILNSKIIVSPWGFGEWCIRDYEAIWGGALLIKPNTDFVYTKPDIYQSGKYYIACKHDFSDLNDIITKVLTNYDDYSHIRKNARDLLKTYNLDIFKKEMYANILPLYNDYITNILPTIKKFSNYFHHLSVLYPEFFNIENTKIVFDTTLQINTIQVDQIFKNKDPDYTFSSGITFITNYTVYYKNRLYEKALINFSFYSKLITRVDQPIYLKVYTGTKWRTLEQPLSNDYQSYEITDVFDFNNPSKVRISIVSTDLNEDIVYSIHTPSIKSLDV